MTSQNSRGQCLDGYVRVSQVAGRQGDSFISPQVQRETIERLAAFNGLTLGEIVEERDVSGGKKVRDRELGRLVEKVEAGQSDGVIVWKLSRFSRRMLDAVEAATRITAAGGRLLASDFDSSAPMGKALLGLMSGLAEEELDARRAGWHAAKTKAVGRGIHISANVPFGYLRPRGERNPRTGKEPTLPLEEDLATSWAVKELFERRAAGESWGSLRQWLVDNELPTVRGADWSVSTLQGLVKNRVYLGEARGAGNGQATPNAHKALIDERIWYAAQGRRGMRRDMKESPSVLRGLVRCGGCRYTMSSRGPDKYGAVVFYCAAKTACPDPTVVTALGVNGRVALEDVVVALVRERERQREERIVFEGFDLSLDVTAEDEEIAKLEAKRDEDAKDSEMEAALGGRQELKRHLAGLTARIMELRAAREEKLGQLGRSSGRPFAEFWEKWDSGEMSMEEKRARLAGVIQAVFVNPAGPGGHPARGAPKLDEQLRRRWFADRVQIVWTDDPPLVDIPRQGLAGYRVTPWPFPDAVDSDPDVLGVVPLQPEVEAAG
jgi:site-specific DNA recombinase